MASTTKNNAGKTKDNAVADGKMNGMKSTEQKNSRSGNDGKSAMNGKNGKASTDTKEDNQGDESLLEKFFLAQLKDIYYAENQLLKAIPTMEEAATTDELKEAFNDHLHETQKQVKRLEKAFESMDKKAEGEKCEAIEGIIREVNNIISETKEGSMTRDAALIMAAQKVEHYEIATYGGLVQLAITIGRHEVSQLLDKTLMEEEDTDRKLTYIAESNINIEAEEEEKFSSRKGNDKSAQANKKPQSAMTESV